MYAYEDDAVDDDDDDEEEPKVYELSFSSFAELRRWLREILD